MFADTRVVNVFPIPVWTHKLAEDQAERVNRSAFKVIDRARSELPDLPPNQSWQTPNDLQDRPELEEFIGLVKLAARGVLGHLRVEFGSFTVTGCWANIMPRGSMPHNRHTHPNNYLSGVYYVQVPAGGNSILFHDPKPQTNIISPRVAAPNEYNTRNATLPVQPGLLIMFPAWLAHSVPPHDGETDRISISFNIMFTEFAEKISRPKWDAAAAERR